MTDDLVKRMEEAAEFSDRLAKTEFHASNAPLYKEAAAEITRLTALVAKLGKVMKEIAETADIGLNIGPVISKARTAAALVKGDI